MGLGGSIRFRMAGGGVFCKNLSIHQFLSSHPSILSFNYSYPHSMQTYQKDFITFLVRSGALKFGEFTLKSGRKCPYFLNFGQFYKGSAIAELGRAYAAAIRENIQDFDIVFGPAYKGIPLSVATTIAFARDFQQEVSYSFNRKEAKDHGDTGMIVGAPITSDSKLIIVDDVMTAGTAMRETVALLSKFGSPKIQGVLIAVDRMERGQGEKSAMQEIFDEFGIRVYSIVNLDQIIECLHNQEIDGQVFIDDGKLAKIREYREVYGV